MDGARRSGAITDFEGVKTLLDTLCQESGVEMLLYSHAVHAETEAGGCRSILIGTECGLLSAEATLFIDATGSGTLARLCGCGYEFGLPENGLPQPCSMSMQAAGLRAALEQFGKICGSVGKRHKNFFPIARKRKVSSSVYRKI